MHAGIRTASGDDGRELLRQLKEGGFDRFLDGRLIRLSLPAGVTGPVILED